jgi:hypothetical protein
MGAILKHGVFKTLRCDFGRENKGAAKSGCLALGIEMQLCTPRDPSVKGLIEQVHACYNRFAQRQPHYAPPTIRNKPLCDEPPLPEAEYIARLAAYAYGEYNTEPYTGQHARGRLSRLEIRQAAAFTPVIPAEDDLRLLFSAVKEVTVHPQGVRLHGLTYTHPALGDRIGQKVLARQGREDTAIIIHDLSNRFVCTAGNALAEAGQLDDEGRRAYTSTRRELAKAQVALADNRVARARTKPDYLLMRAQERMRDQGEAPPQRAVRQITPVTGETPEARAASGPRLKLFARQR